MSDQTEIEALGRWFMLREYGINDWCPDEPHNDDCTDTCIRCVVDHCSEQARQVLAIFSACRKAVISPDIAEKVEKLRRLSPQLDMLQCEDVLQAADALEAQARIQAEDENTALRAAIEDAASIKTDDGYPTYNTVRLLPHWWFEKYAKLLRRKT